MLLPYSQFFRKEAVYMKSHLFKRFINLNTDYVLPKNSIHHVYTVFQPSLQPKDFIDTINLKKFSFLVHKEIKGFWFNNIQVKDDILSELDLGRKIQPKIFLQGYNISFKNYERQLRKFFYIVKDIKGLQQVDKNRFGVVNHNPLSRVWFSGLPEYYHSWFKYLITFNSMFEVINKVPDKLHFLYVPVSLYMEKPTMQKYLNKSNMDINFFKTGQGNWYFWFIFSLVDYVGKKSEKVKGIERKHFCNIFDKLLDSIIELLHFVFYSLESMLAIIIPMDFIKGLVEESPTNIWKFIASLNMLTLDTSTMLSLTENQDEDTLTQVLTESNVKQNKEILHSLTTKGLVKPEEILKGLAEEPEQTNTSVPTDLNSIKFELETKENYQDVIKEGLEEYLKSEGISGSQLVRARKLSEKWKSLKVTLPDGKQITLQKIVQNPPKDISLPTQEAAKGKDIVPDKSYTKSKILNTEQAYMEKLFYYDLINTLISTHKTGLFLTNIKEEEIKDEYNHLKVFRCTYEDINGKKHYIEFKIPIPTDEGYFIVNGVKLWFRKQLSNLPIVKLSPTRVMLSSNYNKTIVERNTGKTYSYANAFISFMEKQKIKFKRSNKTYKTKLPFDYTTIGRKVDMIDNGTYLFTFNYESRFKDLGVEKIQDKLSAIEQDYGVLVGKSLKNQDTYLFMDNASLVRLINIKEQNILDKDVLAKFVFLDKYEEFKVPAEFCYLKILDKNFPVIFILAYRFGLENVLKYLKANYRLVDRGKPYNLTSNEIIIKFKDKALIFNRYPLLHSFILAGWSWFGKELEKHEWEKFNGKDVYYELLDAKGLSINYLKGIDNFFNFFIDPITHDVLVKMGEPTTPRDLLIRAVEMLTDEHHLHPSSLKNFRIRGMDRFPAIVYNEIMRQYAQYLNDKKRDASFSINTEAVLQRIIQDNAMVLYEETNPVHDLKYKTALTHLGFGGRIEEALVEVDRKYPEDGIGIVSEATPDSGKVGVNTFTSFNPNVTDLRGFLNTDGDKEPGNVLSVSGNLVPFVNNDDPKRANFVSIQLSHHLPGVNQEFGRVRTGFDMVMSQFVNSTFAVHAEDDGIIQDIDTKHGLVKVKYKNGKVKVYRYKEVIGEVAGIFIEHPLELFPGIAKGKRVKKGDVIIYNKGFFKPDPLTNSITWCQGVYVNVALTEKDTTFEDSSEISLELSEKLGFVHYELRQFKLTSDIVIKEFKKIGDYVEPTDALMVTTFTDVESLEEIKAGDEELGIEDIIEELQTIKTKAKHKGVIKFIDVFYSCPKNEFHPSVQKFINYVESLKKERYKFAKGAINSELFKVRGEVPPDKKIKKITIGEKALVIHYYIADTVPCLTGDKLVLDSSLKSIISNVYQDPLYTESGVKIDMIFSAKSVFNRIILSPIKQGILERILEKVEKDILEEAKDHI